MNNPTHLDLGFIIREPADVYHAKSKEYLSSHQLGDFRKCPALYRKKKLGLIDDDDRPAYQIGRALHVLVLEGRNKFEAEYAVGGPINPKTGEMFGPTTKAYAEWAAAQGKAVLTGNPVRAELLQEADQQRAQAVGKTVLVLGGSQGAHRVNGLMVEAFAQSLFAETVQVRHQTGSRDEAWVRKDYAAAGVAAQVSSFITDMAAAYREADLVVSRAGATTLAELAVLGKPAILIPYPYAADDHQTTNAAFLARGGAALMFQEQELDGSKLREEIMGLLNDVSRLQAMAVRMKQYARPEATAAIVEKSMELLAA